jgi:hypothetical protein
MKKCTTTILIVATMLQCGIAAAQPDTSLTDRTFTCTHQSATRIVKIVYPQGTALPCQVVYDKSQEGGEVQTLWQAATEEGYCEDKAETFVKKLTDWGWACSEGAGL